MDYKKLADLLFPDVKYTREDLEKKYQLQSALDRNARKVQQYTKNGKRRNKHRWQIKIL